MGIGWCLFLIIELRLRREGKVLGVDRFGKGLRFGGNKNMDYESLRLKLNAI